MVFIGEAARLSGASVKAIRHYDKLGLLQNVSRSGSYRVFSEQDINIIKLIKQAQGLGFKLSELNKAILSTECMPSWSQVDVLIRLKETEITEHISILERKQVRLRQYSKEIRDCLLRTPDCSDPLI